MFEMMGNPQQKSILPAEARDIGRVSGVGWRQEPRS